LWLLLQLLLTPFLLLRPCCVIIGLLLLVRSLAPMLQLLLLLVPAGLCILALLLLLVPAGLHVLPILLLLIEASSPE
jgi:hypothetical protein